MAALLITLGDDEAAILAKAYLAGRPGYLDSVKALMETAADVAADLGSPTPAKVASARNLLGSIGGDIMETVRQARVYVAKAREASHG
ncbi:MAG: hypothetical protein ACOVT5_01930 [Armatimonadaceae bacterium]